MGSKTMLGGFIVILMCCHIKAFWDYTREKDYTGAKEKVATDVPSPKDWDRINNIVMLKNKGEKYEDAKYGSIGFPFYWGSKKVTKPEQSMILWYTTRLMCAKFEGDYSVHDYLKEKQMFAILGADFTIKQHSMPQEFCDYTKPITDLKKQCKVKIKRKNGLGVKNMKTGAYVSCKNVKYVRQTCPTVTNNETIHMEKNVCDNQKNERVNLTCPSKYHEIQITNITMALQTYRNCSSVVPCYSEDRDWFIQRAKFSCARHLGSCEINFGYVHCNELMENYDIGDYEVERQATITKVQYECVPCTNKPKKPKVWKQVVNLYNYDPKDSLGYLHVYNQDKKSYTAKIDVKKTNPKELARAILCRHLGSVGSLGPGQRMIITDHPNWIRETSYHYYYYVNDHLHAPMWYKEIRCLPHHTDLDNCTLYDFPGGPMYYDIAQKGEADFYIYDGDYLDRPYTPAVLLFCEGEDNLINQPKKTSWYYTDD